MRRLLLLCTLGSASLFGCTRERPDEALSQAPSAARAPATAPSQSAPTGPRRPAGPSLAEFQGWLGTLSEKEEYFFSDNYVSNETSTLHVAPALAKRARGGAYLGVGPEQNYTFIALLEPELAFVVDIRRGNLLLHLLYKALFDRSSTRAQLLAQLVGRKPPPQAAGDDTSLQEILDQVGALPKTRGDFVAVHEGLLGSLRKGGIPLDPGDLKTLRAIHGVFFEGGLDTSFSLHEVNGRTYPKLRSLLLAVDPAGAPGSFLASPQSFATIKRMHAEHRIVPVVGDFAGDHALKAIAEVLRARDLPVAAFYVSNVEQYLLAPDKWRAWTRNVESLPTNETSVFIRSYLDQGRAHPRQLPGHRTTTVLQSLDHFRWQQRKAPTRSFFALATEGVLE